MICKVNPSGKLSLISLHINKTRLIEAKIRAKPFGISELTSNSIILLEKKNFFFFFF